MTLYTNTCTVAVTSIYCLLTKALEVLLVCSRVFFIRNFGYLCSRQLLKAVCGDPWHVPIILTTIQSAFCTHIVLVCDTIQRAIVDVTTSRDWSSNGQTVLSMSYDRVLDDLQTKSILQRSKRKASL